MEGLHALLVNFADLMPAFDLVYRAVCYLLGLVLVMLSLMRAARRVELGPGSMSWARPITGFIAGIVLLAIPDSIGVLLGSLFGNSDGVSPQQIFAYTDEALGPMSTPGLRRIVGSFMLLAQCIGYIAVFRGILMLNAAASPSGRGSVGAGLTFLVAGAIAVNFPEFLSLLSVTSAY